MNTLPETCFRCGWSTNPMNVVFIVWTDGTKKPLCASCFSLLLKNGKIQQIGHEYRFVNDPNGPDPMLCPQHGSVICEISEILGYEVRSEGYSQGYERHAMMKEAKELGMTAWIMTKHEFHGRKAEELCRQVIQVRKKRALREALRKASGETFDGDGSPDPSDSNLA